MNAPEPTPYPEINALVSAVLAGARAILGPHFVGMYLEGSLVSADFDQDSDVDFVVVTDAQITPEQFGALQQMHDRIATTPSWYADQLEGSYLSTAALRRYDPENAVHPNLERGPGERLKLAHYDYAWLVHLAILRERGLTLAGPPPQALIDPIAPEALRRAMAVTIPPWVAAKLAAPEQLTYRGAQAYVALTACRMLYTLETGQVVTKRAAARWALEALGPGWAPFVERAWAGRHSAAAEQAASGSWAPLTDRSRPSQPDVAVAPAEIAETLAFLRYILNRSHGVALEPEERGLC